VALGEVKVLEAERVEVVKDEEGVAWFEVAPWGDEGREVLAGFEASVAERLGDRFAEDILPKVMDAFFHNRGHSPLRMAVIRENGEVFLERRWNHGEQERSVRSDIGRNTGSALNPLVERFGHVLGVSSADELRRLSVRPSDQDFRNDPQAAPATPKRVPDGRGG